MSDQPTRSFDSTRLSLFCVDDARYVLQILRMALEAEESISVRVASRSDEALRILIDPDYRPDCILLDMIMPDLGGTMLLGEIRALAHHRNTPVIFLTASAQPVDLRSYRDLGACGLIAKPFDPLTVASQVREILAAPALRLVERPNENEIAISRPSGKRSTDRYKRGPQ